MFRLCGAVIGILSLLMSASLGAQVLPAFTVQTVADGVHVLRAPAVDVAPDNAGFVTNIGVIEDTRGVVLIGTGTSHRFARHLLGFVETRFGKPVIAAVVLYGGGDHVLGNGVFVSRGVPVTAQTETDRFIRASCHTCVERLTAALGENMMSNTEPVPATNVFEASGLLAGVDRRLKLLHFGHSFQPGAVALLDESTGTLFAGELGAEGYLPDLFNASETGWRDALSQLAALDVEHVVPAHGAPGGREVLDAPRRYLEALIARVNELFLQGVSLQDVLDMVDIEEFGDWYGYRIWHRRNVHFAYLHREQIEFGSAIGR